MPEINIRSIVSFSGQHRDFPAENILSNDPTKKWVCNRSTADDKAVITLQLSGVQKISRVEIGNAGSALIEVLVKRTDTPKAEFIVLVVASSFMTPGNARTCQNMNKVRCFSGDQLNPVALDQKWDQIKVVCTQPFNKTMDYGISFIKLYTNEQVANAGEKREKIQTGLGCFLIRDDKDDVKPGSLFANRQNSISDQSSSVTVPKNDLVNPAKNLQPLSTTASLKVQPSALINPEKVQEAEKVAVKKVEKKTVAAPPPTTAVKVDNKPLREVVFVMSGYQNPERSQLRDLAVELGAKYMPDWDPTCTHLICACKNTPKYNSVLNKGYIVTGNWIRACHKKKTHVASKYYSLVDESKIVGPAVKKRKRSSSGDSGTTKRKVARQSSDAAANLANSLPNLLKGCNIFFYGDFPTDQSRLLNRIVTAFNGEVANYMGDDVTHVITCKFDKQCGEALENNNELKFVKPSWLFKCEKHFKLVDVNKFLLVDT